MFDFVTSWTAVCQAPLSSTISRSLLKLMSIELVMLSNHLNLWRYLLLLPSVFPSIRVFSSELALCIRWPKYWSFSCSISPSNEYSGLIAFRIDWFDLLALRETLKSLLQHHNLKASILQHSAFFMIQLSHLYMTTGKTTALTMWTFVSKVMCLLLNMDVKHLSISWLQSLSALILEPKKIKCHFSHFFSFYLPWIDGTRCLDLSFFFFFKLTFKPAFSLSSFTLTKRFFSFSSLSAISVISSVYLRLLIFLLTILIPACVSSSPAWYSAYKLN